MSFIRLILFNSGMWVLWLFPGVAHSHSDSAHSDVVAPLIRQLQDSKAERRSSAARELAKLGSAAQRAAPALARALADDDEEVRAKSADALAQIGRAAFPLIVDALKSPDARVREAATQAVDILGKKGKEAVPVLLGMLNDRNVPVRAGAVKALGSIEDPGLIPVLTKVLLSDPDRTVKANVLRALAVFERQAGPAIPALVRVIELEGVPNAEEPFLSALASVALTDIGPQALPSVLQSLQRKGNKSEARADLAHVVMTIVRRNGGQQARDALPALIGLLDDPDHHVRWRITKAVGSLGVGAKSALGKLSALVKSAPKDEQPVLAWALYRIDPANQQTIPTLCQVLEEGDAQARISAATVLEEIGTKAVIAVPALLKASRDKDADVRLRTIYALSSIAPRLRQVTERLGQLTQDENPSVRHAARSVLNDQ